MMITKQQIDELYYGKYQRDYFETSDDETIEADAQKAFAKLDMGKLKADPLLRRFLQDHANVGIASRKGGTLAPPITSAWEAEGERLLYQLFLGSPSLVLDIVGAHSPNGDTASRLFAYYSMEIAVPYLWRGDILKKAESLPIPRHTIPENLLPYTRMYWSYEGCRDTYATNPDTGEKFEMEADGMLVWYTPPNSIRAGMLGSGYSEGQYAVRLMQTAELRTGTTWPDDYNEFEQASLRPFLAKLSFLNSSYVSTERERLPRPIRRELVKESAPNADPTIHVVKLREVSAPHGGVGDTGREFRNQWWVRAHIRAQWFPSQKGHKLIWIREHLKGPSDAPLIRKIYDVQQ